MTRDLDSRIAGVSIGAAGVVRPTIVDAGGLLEQIFCLSCGRPSGYVTLELPPGVIYVCPDCHDRAGPLPLEALHVPDRTHKES